MREDESCRREEGRQRGRKLGERESEEVGSMHTASNQKLEAGRDEVGAIWE